MWATIETKWLRATTNHIQKVQGSLKKWMKSNYVLFSFHWLTEFCLRRKWHRVPLIFYILFSLLFLSFGLHFFFVIFGGIVSSILPCKQWSILYARKYIIVEIIQLSEESNNLHLFIYSWIRFYSFVVHLHLTDFLLK